MRTVLFLVLTLLPLLAARADAPAAPELEALLRDFLAGASAGNAAMHDRFWAEELIYTSSSGERLGKPAIMASLRADSAAAQGSPGPAYHAEDVEILQFGSTAVVAFRLVAESAGPAGAPQIAEYFNTGTFVEAGGVWRAVAWQATRIPD